MRINIDIKIRSKSSLIVAMLNLFAFAISIEINLTLSLVNLVFFFGNMFFAIKLTKYLKDEEEASTHTE